MPCFVLTLNTMDWPLVYEASEICAVLTSRWGILILRNCLSTHVGLVGAGTDATTGLCREGLWDCKGPNICFVNLNKAERLIVPKEDS